ncbi:MAG: Crp/Fnr family transcriptional regulator [Atopobiaceae bacterium]|jgi:CRP/FNR family transcriptional regulator|nr:Crp/Fnr family transcriptional regulator [Atopobiaceae bacterium]MCH4120540.1 Crp/Fnr family transcriptional regulator [Atopobiaceae bacterium]MCI1389506.1 Crp/Fnr family transcriptional regulator [Atopobiaceae bacterium]MCI1432213.1 Crp/Fnr family transcriptional regulator [Atopobiaceae bacterium]MCI1470671.1 Crp/Fnr family transcriptional regulator [Atopobiaceae bacterium]
MTDRESHPERCETCPFGATNGICVNKIRLFKGLPDDAKHDLVARAVRSSHARGEILVHEGDRIDSVLIVRSGRIKTFRMDVEGEEYVLDVLHDGQAIWHGMFLEDNVYHYSVGCLSPVELCSIHVADVEATLAAHPDATMDLIRMVCTELDDAEEKAMMLGIRDPRRRVAQYLLLRHARCLGDEIRLTLDEIAASVGLRPETVSRTISGFAKDGLVRRAGRGRLLILDHDGLQALV